MSEETPELGLHGCTMCGGDKWVCQTLRGVIHRYEAVWGAHIIDPTRPKPKPFYAGGMQCLAITIPTIVAPFDEADIWNVRRKLTELRQASQAPEVLKLTDSTEGAWFSFLTGWLMGTLDTALGKIEEQEREYAAAIDLLVRTQKIINVTQELVGSHVAIAARDA